MEGLVRGRHHLIACEPAATDKHDMANFAMLPVNLARLVPHLKLAVGTNRRPERRLLLKSLDHDTTPPLTPVEKITVA
jgi:hypothetical protein